MTLEIDDETETLIRTLADRERISAAQLLKNLLNHYSASVNNDELLVDMMDSLPELPTFKGNPLEIQRAMRHEWD